MTQNPILKSPEERFSISLDWQGVAPYAENNTLVSSSATITDRQSDEPVNGILDDPAGLITGSKIYYTLEGGEHGKAYNLNILTRFQNGNVLKEVVPMLVRVNY